MIQEFVDLFMDNKEIEVATMQSLINEEYGTFDDDAHEVYRFDDTSPGVVIVRDNIVVSYETVGGLMFDWVVGVVEEEE